jgi:hypothetical protein
MDITTTHISVPCHTMQLVLSVFYVHNFISLIMILLIDTRFRKREFPVVSKRISQELQNMYV